ncbi:MAG TPA: hypothetical protein VHD87_14375 [Acidimicrobiales bacterium]|nr:hypothetical protein [Acidimicrobiales bacterium]
MDEREAHQYFAVQAFNAAWELIEKPDRTPDDDAAMLERAFASRWHWGFVGGPEQTATGDWQIAHCASLLGYGWMAQQYAQRAFDVCEREGWTDWQRASMLEGMARAAAVAGDAAAHRRYYALAEEAVAAIAEEEERSVIASQLATVPKP